MDKSQETAVKIMIAQELEKGTSLSDIQTMVNEKFSMRMTYMDIRILASTLDVDWRSLDPNAAKNVPADTDDSAVSVDDPEKTSGAESLTECEENDSREMPENGATDETSAGDTVVEVSPIARPGMALSGTVKFASGSTAEWYVDSYGRLGVENLEGDKPSQNDIEKFQVELNKVVRKMMGQ